MRRYTRLLCICLLFAVILSSCCADAAVQTGEPSYAPHEPIEIIFDNLPGNQTDWMTLVPREHADDQYREWFTTGGMRSGRHLFEGMPAGIYEARVYYDWPTGGYAVQERAAVFVEEPTAQRPLPLFPNVPAEPQTGPVPLFSEAPWSESGQGTLFAPGHGAHNYRIHELDMRRFVDGGTLIVDVQIGTGQSWGSVDLYGKEQPPATSGLPKTLASEWNLPPSSNRRLTHVFKQGGLFLLCFEGNWGSPQGATNTYIFTATVGTSTSESPLFPPKPEPTTSSVPFPTPLPGTPTKTSDGRQQAETLWKQGVALQQQKRYEEALLRYKAGLALFNDPALAEHVAGMVECLGRLQTLPNLPAVQPEAPEYELFSNWNRGNVVNNPVGPPAPTRFTISRPHVVTYIATCHYFNNGLPAGSITLVHQDGTLYGPWRATGQSAKGGVPDALWVAQPEATLKPGTYSVFDSHPPTWSHNAQSELQGFVRVKGRIAQ